MGAAGAVRVQREEDIWVFFWVVKFATADSDYSHAHSRCSLGSHVRKDRDVGNRDDGETVMTRIGSE